MVRKNGGFYELLSQTSNHISKQENKVRKTRLQKQSTQNSSKTFQRELASKKSNVILLGLTKPFFHFSNVILLGLAQFFFRIPLFLFLLCKIIVLFNIISKNNKKN